MDISAQYLTGNSKSTSPKLNYDPVTLFLFLISVNDTSELEIWDAVSYSNTNSCIFN